MTGQEVWEAWKESPKKKFEHSKYGVEIMLMNNSPHFMDSTTPVSIEYFEIKLATHKDLTPINLKVTECTLKELKGKKSLLGKLNDDMIERKWCYRYGMWMVEQCDVCERCLKAEDLQWNEGEK